MAGFFILPGHVIELEDTNRGDELHRDLHFLREEFRYERSGSRSNGAGIGGAR